MVASPGAKRYAGRVVRQLRRHYPDAQCALHFNSPLELLVATILSAQCTDERVNLVTKDLFKTYRCCADFARAGQSRLEGDIKSTGFFRNKAKSIRQCCQALEERHGGRLPEDIEALVQLPGIGRKTANVVLGTAFGIASGIVVDTHVARLSRRLGLTQQKDAARIEQDLMEQIPRKDWIAFGHQMIHHGRRVCTARSPKCEECPLGSFCPRVGVAAG